MGLRKPGNKKSKKSTFRKVSDWLHLWLGLIAGAVVFVVAITGCIYVFQVEISEAIHHDEIFITPPKKQQTLPISYLQLQAEKHLGKGKKINFISTYQSPQRAWEFGTFKGGDPNGFFYFDAVDYYDVVWVNPYTGKVTLAVAYKYEFFNVVKMLHWSLLINHPIGQQIVGWSTIIFVVLLITGLIMWWPKNLKKSNFDKSFKIKWKAKFKRLNYDLHNVPGFYALLITLVLSLTGLVWAFQWFQKTVYVLASGTTAPPSTKTFNSDTTKAINSKAFDLAFENTRKLLPDAIKIGISPAIGKAGVIYANGYRDEETYYDSDDLQFDQYSGKLLENRKHSEKNAGERLIGMNYDIHVGAILGLPGKILAFLASLIAASLPITGVIIWLGKKKKSKTKPITA
ncbi:MAG: PepSY-associated TM helix domain-containing protein [Pedobacter sp.]|nr:PepSY-associated TM helix domain-containing protein [Pedobacter sp.]MDQ8054533.1 PepSY-associated TM helix domain-containing protein [Pedobacter sp.]